MGEKQIRSNPLECIFDFWISDTIADFMSFLSIYELKWSKWINGDKMWVSQVFSRSTNFLCLMLSVRLFQPGPRRIPLWGLRMILFSAVCICWFDNPVISPSQGDSGSANTQQHTNSWTVTAAIVPPKQCLHFDVCDAWPAEGSFFNLCFSTQFPLLHPPNSTHTHRHTDTPLFLLFPAEKPINYKNVINDFYSAHVHHIFNMILNGFPQMKNDWIFYYKMYNPPHTHTAPFS